jgi:hypothetical protein
LDTSKGSPSPFRTVIESIFQIVDKDGITRPFKLNSVQQKLDNEWHRRLIVPKARQGGISSYVIARYTAKCLGLDNRRCVIVSHEADATARLLDKVHFTLDNLLLDQKPVLGRKSRNEIYFEKTNSTIWIGTAGSRNFGHGDTITDLHLSEPARYPDTEAIISGLFPAAERGEIVAESTGNGVGNWYHRQCVRAREGHGFKLLFFPWTDMSEYRIDDVDEAAFIRSLDPDIKEPDLFATGVSVPQLAWRRERLNIDFERDLRAFEEAYPFTFDECFQSKGYGFFQRVRYVPTSDWVREDAFLHRLSDHPKPGMGYVVGVDPAGGNGGNNSVAEVFCLQTSEQVAEWASNRLEPPEFADRVADLALRFNNAYVNVERNNHGLTFIARFVQIYPTWLIHKNTHIEQTSQVVMSRLANYGTMTGPANRGIMLGTTRRMLASDFMIHSDLLNSELHTVVEKEDGKIEADDGCLDDRVFATIMAMIVVERAGVKLSEPVHLTQDEKDLNPFSFDSIFSETVHNDIRHGISTRFG